MTSTNGTSAPTAGRRYTLSDWRAWPEGERWELIHGTPYSMSPAPRTDHQETTLDLAFQLRAFLHKNPRQAFVAPLDVFLGEAQDTVVQPDVMVVCNPARIRDDGIHGAPDFVAEVLSESTSYKDWGAKKDLYEQHGVGEYWIIHPYTRVVYKFVRDEGRFAPVVEIRPDLPVPSAVLDGGACNALIDRGSGFRRNHVEMTVRFK